jgi:hypothetical protein
MISRVAASIALVSALAGAVAIVAGASTTSREAVAAAVLDGGYTSALADADTSWSSLPRNIWLSGLGGGIPNISRALVPGDTITVRTQNGQPHVIQVLSVEKIEGERVGVPATDFQLVTGRGIDGGEGAHVRFLFAAETPLSMPLAVPGDRVL